MKIDANVRYKGPWILIVSAVLCAFAFGGVAIALKYRIDQNHKDAELTIQTCKQGEELKRLLIDFIAKTTGYDAKTGLVTTPEGQTYTTAQKQRIVRYNLLARQQFAIKKC